MTKTTRNPRKSVATSKADKIIRLLQRNKGASIPEMSKATDWQAHSVRGFLSGTLKKKLGYQIKSEQEDGRHRRYFISGGDR